MSADTLTASNSVVNDEINPATTNNTEYAEYSEQTESSSTNGLLHTNGAEENHGTTSEPIIEGQTESTKETYDTNSQSSFNKSDLEPEVFRKVFIGGLSYKTDEQTFRDYFSKYGTIEVIRQCVLGCTLRFFSLLDQCRIALLCVIGKIVLEVKLTNRTKELLDLDD